MEKQPKQTPPTEEVKELVQNVQKISEDGKTSKEKEKVEEVGKRLREFIARKEGESYTDIRKREDALTGAIQDVAAQENVNAVWIYGWIFGKVGGELLGQPPTKETFEFLEHEENFQKIKSVAPPLLQRLFLTRVADEKPGHILDWFQRRYQQEPYGEELLERAARSAAKEYPDDALRYYSVYKNHEYAHELLEPCVRRVVGEDPASALELFDAYRGESYAEEILEQAVHKTLEINPPYVMKHYPIYCTRPYAEQTLLDAVRRNPEGVFMYMENLKDAPSIALLARTAAAKDPRSAISHFSDYQDTPFAKDILLIVARVLPEAINEYSAASKFGSRPYAKEILQVAKALTNAHNTVLSTRSFSGRDEQIRGFLAELNTNIDPALQAFNRSTGLSLAPMGIRKQPYEIVFINTFDGSVKLPMRIALTVQQISDAKTQKELTTLLHREYTTQRRTLEAQYALWEKGDSFDLSKEKTSVLLVSAPGHLTGIETDVVRMAEIYRTYYDARIEGLFVDNLRNWKDTPKGHVDALPEAQISNASAIRDALGVGLQKAVMSGQETFVFHYDMHGRKSGKLDAVPAKLVFAERTVPREEAELDATDFAEAISLPDQKSGRPLCSLINIVIVAESCYSGKQLDIIVEWLHSKKVPVRSLRIATAASRETPASAGVTVESASLVSDKMRGDNAGALSYYLSYYFELLDHLRERRARAAGIAKEEIELEKPLGTFGHAIQFADRMAREDSDKEPEERQDLQGYHYSTEEGIDRYFSGTRKAPGTQEGRVG